MRACRLGNQFFGEIDELVHPIRDVETGKHSSDLSPLEVQRRLGLNEARVLFPHPRRATSGKTKPHELAKDRR